MLTACYRIWASNLGFRILKVGLSVQDIRFRAWGESSGFRVQGCWFGIQRLWLQAQDAGFLVQGLGFFASVIWFLALGVGLRVWGSGSCTAGMCIFTVGLIWEAVGMVTFLMGNEGVWGKLLDGERRGSGGETS